MVQHQEQQEDQGSGWNFTRLGLVGVVVGVAAWAWQAFYGTSAGVIYKPEPVYDFIIVGGGTAGCVMAARLSEVEHYRVLLVEAGGEEPWLSNIPLAAPLLQKSRFDWQYLTTPQKSSSLALVDKQSSWPRGRVLGGSATINYNIHMFGSPQDFQVWEDEYGATGWGFDEMKKYANKAECRRLRPKIFKQDQCSSNLGEKKQKGCSNSSRSSEGSKLGDGGHIRQHQDAVQCYSPPIRVHTAASTLTNTFLAAGKELGLPVGNLNDDIDYGVMAAQTTVFKGRRWSASTGYLRPALGRPNLHVLIHTHVSRILWEGKRAIGVEFVQWNNAHLNGSVFARGEVILAAGAINTPLLLTHSGVGPKSILQKFNIPAISLLEGVGGNLQDHLNLPLYVSLEKSASLNPAKMGTLTNLWDYFIKGGKGDLGRTAIEGVGVMPLTGDQPEVGVILFNMGSVDKHLYSSIANIKLDYFDATFPNMDNQSAEGFIFLTSCLHPKSRGRVQLVSSDPRHPPSIDPNYLHHPYDITCMRDAFKFAMHLARTKAFQNLGATVHLPRHEECIPRGSRGETSIGGGGEDARSRYQDYVNCLVRVNAITGYHPLGTTRIGHPDDPKAVVDPKLRVIGTDRLRVVDASVMPTQISGTPNSAIVVIAEKAADLLRESWSDKSILTSEKICSSTPDCEEELLANISNLSPASQSIFSVMIIFSVIWATYPYTSVTAIYL